MKPAREPASSRLKPCASLKKPHESCPFAAPCSPRREKMTVARHQLFPQKPPGSRLWFPRSINRVRLLILLRSWSAEQGKCIFPCPRLRLRIWSREMGSAVPSRVCLLILRTQSEYGFTGLLPISAVTPIYLFKPPYVIGSVPSLSDHAIAYRWRSPPRVRRHRASSLLKVVPVTRVCCLYITMD